MCCVDSHAVIPHQSLHSCMQVKCADAELQKIISKYLMKYVLNYNAEYVVTGTSNL
jgi:hypothetical protein